MELAERVVRGRKAITLAKQRGMDTAVWERHLERLLAKAGLEPTLEEGWSRGCSGSGAGSVSLNGGAFSMRASQNRIGGQ
jgi:hypothetical protein